MRRRRSRRRASGTARRRPARRDGRRGCRRGCRPRRSRCGNSRRAPRARARRSPRPCRGTACGRAAAAARRRSRAAGCWSSRAANIRRRAASCSSIVRRVCGLTWTVSTLRMRSSEQMPSSAAVTPARVGVGQFGQIAGPHQHLGLGQRAAQLDVARSEAVKPKWIGSRTGSSDEGDAPVGALPRRRAASEVEIAGLGRDQHRRRAWSSAARSSVCSSGSAGNRRRPAAPRASSSDAAESTLTREARGLQRPDRLLEMRERRVGQAAEVDHVGARRLHVLAPAPAWPRPRAPTHRRSRRRCACRGATGRAARRVPRIGRQVGDLVRTALERHAELGGQARRGRRGSGRAR